MRPGLIAAVLATVFLISAPASADSQLARLTAATGKPDRVVVIKSDRTMALMRGDTVLRVYTIALGRYPEGHKTEQGDAKTPEGTYTLSSRVVNSKFHRAIRISYPNSADRAQARARGVHPGGNIMIHGLPNDWSASDVNHPKLDWTQGCIAVTNEEMEEIWALVPNGTPIEIHP